MIRAETRRAARVLIIDERGRMLLFGYREPMTGDEFWATPGGGIESGESPHEAARREVLEETGHLPPEQLGPVIWIRQLSFTWNDVTLSQHEVYFVWRVEHFDVDPSLVEQLSSEDVIGCKWVTTDEIRGASGWVPAPRLLADLVDELDRNGPPMRPIHLDA